MMPRRTIFIIAILILTPVLACANAGTPLMWVTSLHLMFGNLLIGLFEAALLVHIFKARPGKSSILMIGANYVSAWVGIPVIALIHAGVDVFFRGPERLYYAGTIMAVSVLILFLVTIVLEWPFVWLVFKGDPLRRRKSIRANLAVQAVSYAVLVFIYFNVSFISLATEAKVERDLRFAKNPGAAVYYLGGDGAVWRKRLDRKPAERVMDARSTNDRDRLFARQNAETQKWDLWILRSQYGSSNGAEECLIRDFARRAEGSGRDAGNEPDTWFNMRRSSTIDFRPKDRRQWETYAGFWAAEGIYAENESARKAFNLSMESPVMQWFSRNATILPGDQVVYQLDDMIVLLDLNTRQLGVVTMGHGPAVGMD